MPKKLLHSLAGVFAILLVMAIWLAVNHSPLGSLWVLLAAALLTFLVNNRIGRPIKQLTELAKQMAESDFTHRMPLLADDEIGRLAQAFNHMADNMSSQIEQLTQRQQELHTILDCMREGVLAVDSNGVLLHVNPAATQLLSISPENRRPRPLVETIRHPELIKALDQVLLGESRQVELDLTYPSPKIIDVTFTPVPYKAHDPAAIQAIAILRDVTELRGLERVRRDFVSNVSHELRTPLTAIKGFAETLRETDDAAERDTYLKIIDEEADRLVALASDLLQLADLENTNQPLATAPIDPTALIGHAVQLLEARVKEKKLQLKVVSGEKQCLIGHEKMLEQVLINLLDNAVKYTPAGGYITISHVVQGDNMRFTVADNGAGIDPRYHMRIFERFYRVDTARSRVLGGTGLGLSIVKHIVERHGGTVGVESKLGHGAEFWFDLPLTPPPSPSH